MYSHKINVNGDLSIIASQTASEELRYERDVLDRSILAIEAEVLEPFICNGFDWIYPEEIGALTSAPIIGEVERDDNGVLVRADKVWWYPDYAIRSFVDDLIERGYTTLKKAE